MNELSEFGARRPQQQRGQARVEAVLAGARALLLDGGLGALTVPALADRLGFSRMSIYHFFRTPESILDELTNRALKEFEQRIVAEGVMHPERHWTEQIAGMVQVLTDYFNEDAVGQLVILGSGLTAEGYKAQSTTVLHLGEMTNQLFENSGLSLSRKPINAAVLMVDLGMTVARMSVQLHGHITPVFQKEVVDSMVRYLTPYVEAAAAGSSRGQRGKGLVRG